jgi:hypothetical protein
MPEYYTTGVIKTQAGKKIIVLFTMRMRRMNKAFGADEINLPELAISCQKSRLTGTERALENRMQTDAYVMGKNG